MKPRKAIYKNKLCFVHGIFQGADKYMSEPIAVVEFEDGRVVEAAPTQLVFTESPLLGVNTDLLEALRGLYEHTKNDHTIHGLNVKAQEAISDVFQEGKS